MRTMRLGRESPQISALGLGCSSLSARPRDEDEGVATLQAALDAGIALLNTADFYGSGHNEALFGRAISGRRRNWRSRDC